MSEDNALEVALHESTMRRGWGDFKKGLTSWQFWAIQALGGGIVGLMNPEKVLAFIAAVAAAMWIGATATAPVKQRNEARARLRSFVTPKFKVVSEPEEGRPYLQILNGPRPPGQGQPAREHTDRRYRIGVRSLCGVTIPNVRAVLVDVRHLGEERFWITTITSIRSTS